MKHSVRPLVKSASLGFSAFVFLKVFKQKPTIPITEQTRKRYPIELARDHGTSSGSEIKTLNIILSYLHVALPLIYVALSNFKVNKHCSKCSGSNQFIKPFNTNQ